MSTSLTSLITRVIADDDRHAYDQIVRLHQSQVRAFLRRLTGGSQALADDLGQETFLEAYRNLARFRAESSFISWLLGIAYNRYRSHVRRQKPTVEWTEDTATAGDPASMRETRATLTAGDLQHDLAAALARLPQAEQAALHLCYIVGLSHEEAALALDCPLGTVKTHVLRGKEKLRHYLQPWAPTPSP